MASESLIELNVGGQMYQTSVKTLTKYPGSLLEMMFKHTEKGLSPMQKTKKGHSSF